MLNASIAVRSSFRGSKALLSSQVRFLSSKRRYNSRNRKSRAQRARIKAFDVENVTILRTGSDGKCIGRDPATDKVIFVEKAVPGDVLDVTVNSRKKRFDSGVMKNIVTASPDRITPFCEHQAVCGGCKWQQMNYPAQLRCKQELVQEAFRRATHTSELDMNVPEALPTLASPETEHYRTKCEYTFTAKKWMTTEDIASGRQWTEQDRMGLGYYLPGEWSKIFDVQQCFLQDKLGDTIRNGVRAYAQTSGMSFYNVETNEGHLRSLVLHRNARNEWMVVVVFGDMPADSDRDALLSFIQTTYAENVVSIQWVRNEGSGPSWIDQPMQKFFGTAHLLQDVGDLRFKNSPKSFFQSNSSHVQNLFNVVKDYAGLTGKEVVYDLYCGTGTIGLYLSDQAASVVGIDVVDTAIEDALYNTALNNVKNAEFHCMDMKLLEVDTYDKPDVIVVDPPRAGLTPLVIDKLLTLAPARIVYVSCNPATQARDAQSLVKKYKISKMQPVDMFPHTHHVENVVLFERKE